MKLIKLAVVLVSMAFSSIAMGMEISRNNYVDWVATSSVASSESNFIQWKNPLASGCQLSGLARTRFSINDDALLSLLLTAKVSNKKVGFYYELIATTGPVPGHGSACQIVNAWLESD